MSTDSPKYKSGISMNIQIDFYQLVHFVFQEL